MEFKSSPTKEIILEMLKHESKLILSGTALRHLTVTEIPNYIKDSILYKIHTFIPAENVKEKTYTVYVSYPDGWFQMFKESHFPKFLKEHFPIKYKTKIKTVTFTAYIIYPQLPQVYDCGNTKQIILTKVI